MRRICVIFYQGVAAAVIRRICVNFYREVAAADMRPICVIFHQGVAAAVMRGTRIRGNRASVKNGNSSYLRCCQMDSPIK